MDICGEELVPASAHAEAIEMAKEDERDRLLEKAVRTGAADAEVFLLFAGAMLPQEREQLRANSEAGS